MQPEPSAESSDAIHMGVCTVEGGVLGLTKTHILFLHDFLVDRTPPCRFRVQTRR